MHLGPFNKMAFCFHNYHQRPHLHILDDLLRSEKLLQNIEKYKKAKSKWFSYKSMAPFQILILPRLNILTESYDKHNEGYLNYIRTTFFVHSFYVHANIFVSFLILSFILSYKYGIEPSIIFSLQAYLTTRQRSFIWQNIFYG
jgi:hypothetical protein